MGHGKVDVEHSYELWVSLDDFTDAFPSERLLPESSLYLVQDLLMAGLGLIEHYGSAKAQPPIGSKTHHS